MKKNSKINNPFIITLGIMQDGGLPQCGCNKSCCNKAWKQLSARKNVVSIGIIDPQTKQKWLIDATPDLKHQLNILNQNLLLQNKILDGIFLTHGHIGHYIGLINFEKALLNTTNISVFCMPKMNKFLAKNRPWKDLIDNKNIKIIQLENNKPIFLNKRISIIPFTVPHRAEYSETIGVKIIGPNKSILFIPDIDKWELLSEPIENMIQTVNIAFLDGTFFDKNELPNRDITKIPHPFIKQSMLRFQNLPKKEKNKIFFIHFNHTNPVLKIKSNERIVINKNGFRIATENKKFQI